MTGITENAFINIKGRSYAVTAEVDVPPGGANGVIIAQAGRFGGWSLYMKDGRVHDVYNFGGLERTTVSSPQALSPGTSHDPLRVRLRRRQARLRRARAG